MGKSLAGLLAPLAPGEELGRLPLAAVEARTQDWAAALGLFVRLAGEEGRLAAAVFPARDQQAEVLARVGRPPSLLLQTAGWFQGRLRPGCCRGPLRLHSPGRAG